MPADRNTINPSEIVPESSHVVYVYLTSGEVATVSPASSVVVQPDRVIVYDGARPVASYRRREVFSCSRTEESPAFT